MNAACLPMILFSPASAMTARSRRHSTAVRSVMKNGEESMACRKMPVERTSILALKCLSIFCDDGLPPPPAVAGACRAHNVGAVAGRPEKVSAPAALPALQGKIRDVELDIPHKLREVQRGHRAMNLCRCCAYARKTPGKEKRLCMFTGERFTDDTPAGDCTGWVPGRWDEKKEMPRRDEPGQGEKGKLMRCFDNER